MIVRCMRINVFGKASLDQFLFDQWLVVNKVLLGVTPVTSIFVA